MELKCDSALDNIFNIILNLTSTFIYHKMRSMIDYQVIKETDVSIFNN